MKCCHCKQEKPIETFNFKTKKEGIRQKACRECTRKQVRNHYDQNKKYYLEKAQRRNSIQKKKMQKYIWNYLLKNPCIDCGEKDPLVLDFDHQNNKLHNISDLKRGSYSLKTILIEIQKCEVRCANCHRRKTARTNNWLREIID